MKLWHKIALISAVIAAVICLGILMFKDKQQLNSDKPLFFADAMVQGMPIVQRSEWQARPVDKSKLDYLELPVVWVIISHTSSDACATESECAARVRTIQAADIKRNLTDIRYNFLVGGDGSVYVGRGWEYVSPYISTFNITTIDISFIGGFNTLEPKEQQVVACQKLLEIGQKLGYIAPDYKLYAGRQKLQHTSSPGDVLYAMIKKWPNYDQTAQDVW